VGVLEERMAEGKSQSNQNFFVSLAGNEQPYQRRKKECCRWKRRQNSDLLVSCEEVQEEAEIERKSCSLVEIVTSPGQRVCWNPVVSLWDEWHI
jgi:hypothetical protein